MVDELTLISGTDVVLPCGLRLMQPRLRTICDPACGEARYNTYVSIFDLTLQDVFGEDASVMPQEIVDHIHIFDLLTGTDGYCQTLLEALRFFLGQDVQYDAAHHVCRADDGTEITRNVYDEIAPAVLQISCVQPKRESAKTYANKRAQKIFEKIQKKKEEQRRRKKADPNYTISNIVSKLSSKHPSYNLLNIWDLTVYQVYDQFACTCLNTQLDVIGLRWAAWGKEDFDFSQWYTKHN